MRSFSYERPADVEGAVEAGRQTGARFIAGGTNLLDLMKADVEQPRHLVDISRLPLREVADTAQGGLHIGALVSNADLAADDRVRRRYPMLALALLNGASPQLRNQATIAGNLLQRTRCPYFYDVSKPCNKRSPGSGCSALGGYNRLHAVLGRSEACIAVHPSDMAVAMAALDAEVEIQGAAGPSRTPPHALPIAELHRLPGTTPERDTVLEAGDLITGITLPPPPAGRQTYRKVRDRASYAFALVSVAAVLGTVDGRISEARLALGGLAHKPWRAREAEQVLVGRAVDKDAFDAAGVLALKGATGGVHNTFKIELAQRTAGGTLADLARRGG